MPGFVKTDEELERIAAILNPFRYVTEALSVDFDTTWEFARFVLPPCFEPVGDQDDNRASANVGVSDIYCPHYGPYEAGLVTVRARYGDIEGGYLILALHDTEGHIHSGRDVWRGPKKIGRARIFHDGDRHFAYGERNGRRLFEIEAEMSGPDLAPQTSSSTSFSLTMVPHPTARGLQYPPLLNIWQGDSKSTSQREGTGTLRFGQSEWDPVQTIPVVSVGTARVTQYVADNSHLAQQVELEDPGDIYARYLWGTWMDDATFEDIPARWRPELEVNGSPRTLLDAEPALP